MGVLFVASDASFMYSAGRAASLLSVAKGLALRVPVVGTAKSKLSMGQFDNWLGLLSHVCCLASLGGYA
jgi:hypothetical protein